MNILYLSSCCSDKKFEKLRQEGITQKLPQAQKYHRLLLEGLSQCKGVTVTAISAIPVNRQWTKKAFFPHEEETRDGVPYIYDAFWNYPILRQLCRKCGAMKEIKKHYRDGDTVIICDVLNQALAAAARKAGRKLGIPVIGIVTDVPGHTSGARRKSLPWYKRKIEELAEKRAQSSLPKYDGYLLLAEAMNSVVNPMGKPYIVLEGHCDGKMAQIPNLPEEKRKPRVIMYAGGIHKEFGIKRMVEAFCAAAVPGWELRIYGDGNYQNELKALTAKIESVKYYGVVPNSVVVTEQIKASLLVNPRLTDAEYVKYSFPSKTMECMASGTPLLTTHLPSMPKEYFDHVYFINDETAEGMKKTFLSILTKTDEELHQFGRDAKAFILENKTNTKQAAKLTAFISGLQKE